MTTTTHYKIHIHTTDTYLKVTYRGKSFSKLERLKGSITDNMLMEIGRIIPPRLNEISKWEKHFKEKLSIEPIEKKKTQFSQFNDAWFQFYEDFTGFPPKFGATEASHLKKIITHLTKVGGSPEEALNLWNTILSAWPKLSEFHKENTDIKYINSRLNVILNAVKKQSTQERPPLVELITASHYKNRLVVQHYGKMTMQTAMNASAPTVGKLSRENGQDHFIECLGRVFVGTSLYFDKPLSIEEGEIIAVEILNDYEMSNLKLEDIVVIIKEIKESEIYGRLTANKIIKHIKSYWKRRLKAAVSDSINNSQSNKDGADMADRVKKTIALPDAQLNRVDRTRNHNNKYLK